VNGSADPADVVGLLTIGDAADAPLVAGATFTDEPDPDPAVATYGVAIDEVGIDEVGIDEVGIDEVVTTVVTTSVQVLGEAQSADAELIASPSAGTATATPMPSVKAAFRIPAAIAFAISCAPLSAGRISGATRSQSNSALALLGNSIPERALQRNRNELQ
jgi:hypothetical protein